MGIKVKDQEVFDDKIIAQLEVVYPEGLTLEELKLRIETKYKSAEDIMRKVLNTFIEKRKVSRQREWTPLSWGGKALRYRYFLIKKEEKHAGQ